MPGVSCDFIISML